MKDIRVIEALYHEHCRMWEYALVKIIHASKHQKYTSNAFKHLISDITDKVYGSYVEASHTYFETLETNPDLKASMLDPSYRFSNTEEPISDLVSGMRVAAALFTTRQKFLDMLNILISTAENEQNIGSFFVCTVISVKEPMTEMFMDALAMYYEKKKEFDKLGVNPEPYFDDEMLYIIKNMQDYDYAYAFMVNENTSTETP